MRGDVGSSCSFPMRPLRCIHLRSWRDCALTVRSGGQACRAISGACDGCTVLRWGTCVVGSGSPETAGPDLSMLPERWGVPKVIARTRRMPYKEPSAMEKFSCLKLTGPSVLSGCACSRPKAVVRSAMLEFLCRSFVLVVMISWSWFRPLRFRRQGFVVWVRWVLGNRVERLGSGVGQVCGACLPGFLKGDCNSWEAYPFYSYTCAPSPLPSLSPRWPFLH